MIILKRLWLCGFLVFSSQVFAYTLTAAVQQTLGDNPEALRSKASKLAAQENVRAAWGGFLPIADIRFAVGRERTYNVDSVGTDVTLTRSESNFAVTQPLFSGLSTYNLLNQRKGEAAAESFKDQAVQENLALRTTQVYLDVLRLQKIYELTLANVAMHKQILNKVSMKFKGGAGRKTEVELATGRLAQRLATLQAIIGARQNANSNFVNVVGILPVHLVLPKAPIIPDTLLSAQRIALQNNPDLQAAGEEFLAAKAALAGSKAPLFPTLNLQFVHDDNRDIGGIRGPDRDYRGMLVANYNLFRGGSDLANILRAKQLRNFRWHNQAVVYRRIVTITANAWHDLAADRKQVSEIARHVSNITKVAEGYNQQFELGRRTLLDLLNIESEVLTAKADLVNAKYAVLLDKYKLLASIGALKKHFV